VKRKAACHAASRFTGYIYPWRILAEGFHHAAPTAGQAGVEVAAAGFDDHIAALELGIFVNPVAGMGQLVAGPQSCQ
jgi:hypothetical protein